MGVAMTPVDRLVEAARAARRRGIAPFSGFRVGAALETAEGAIITGCNIENATLGLTLCAERVALVKALSEGHHAFVRLAVVADTRTPTSPCGPCRQLVWEFAGDIEVVLADLHAIHATFRMGTLLPYPFDASVMGGGQGTRG